MENEASLANAEAWLADEKMFTRDGAKLGKTILAELHRLRQQVETQDQGFLSLCRTPNGRVYAKKRHPNVVIIISITADGNFILTEQEREPVENRVIEFPAGHIGDDPNIPNESVIEAAKRELLEEVGYTGRFLHVGAGVSSPGMTDENNHFVLATELVKVGEGGGVDDEDITTHLVPMHDVDKWLRDSGYIISAKTYAGLWMARHLIKSNGTGG